MKITQLCLAVLLSAGLAGASAHANPNITSTQASSGLKEALSRGISAAVTETGRPGGYENNPLIRIVMPDRLKWAEKGLRTIGMGAPSISSSTA